MAKRIGILTGGGDCLRSGEIVSAPLDLAVPELKRIDPQGDLVRATRSLRIELG
jgi:hypothetical protein